MKSILRYSFAPMGAMIAVCAVMIGTAYFALMTHAGASDNTRGKDRLVTIHDRGGERVILTNATTIRQALQEADIALDGNDTVEPSLGEKLVANTYYVNIYRARPVIVVDGAIRQKIMTPYQTADKIAEDAGLDLHDEDQTSLRATQDIVSEGAGTELSIDRATPFTLGLYGKKEQAYTQAATIADMLKEKNIILGPNDAISLDQQAPVAAGMTVEIWRNGKQTVTEDKEIPFEIEKIQDADREVGYREVKTPGVKGKKSVTYEIEMKNGKESSRKEIQNVTLEQPKKQVEIIGTKRKNFGGNCDQWIAAAGINDLANAHYLIGKESGCNPYAVNRSSGACGVGQALPCSKTGCEMGDGACQTKWMNSYVLGRYGSWAAAADHHRRVGWY